MCHPSTKCLAVRASSQRYPGTIRAERTMITPGSPGGTSLPSSPAMRISTPGSSVPMPASSTMAMKFVSLVEYVW